MRDEDTFCKQSSLKQLCCFPCFIRPSCVSLKSTILPDVLHLLCSMSMFLFLHLFFFPCRYLWSSAASSWWAQTPQPLCPLLPSVQWVSGNNVGLLLLTKSVLVFTAPFKLLPQEISQAHWQALISSRKYPSRKLKKERCAVIIFVLGSQDRGRWDIN